MGENKSLGNIFALGGKTYGAAPKQPAEYAGRRRQYYRQETAQFHADYAQYASDYFLARIQGLNPENFEEWLEMCIRMADVGKGGTTQTYPQDDWKQVLIPSPTYDYLPAGAKIETMGSTWLCVNPQNISGGMGNGIVRKCNATWNHLDFYGNVLKEPIAIDNSIAKAPAPDPQDYNIIARGYYSIQAQKNDQTLQLNVNSRIVIGNAAFAIVSYTPFMQEFTEDGDSGYLIRFNAQYQEPNYEIDDMERHVAGGKTFRWDIRLSGPGVIPPGGTGQMQAESTRMGETVLSTEEQPIGYLWESSDPDVASIDETGFVKGVGAGKATITARLAQNPDIQSEAFQVEVQEGRQAAFLKDPPDSLRAYQSARIMAGLYVNGELSTESAQWSWEGKPGAFSIEIDGNTAIVTAYQASASPLTVTAAFGNERASAQIKLAGI